MTTDELIGRLRATDPDGNREVWLEIPTDDPETGYMCYTDLAIDTRVDWADDIVISAQL
jgi:hypothetical protein